MVSRVRVGLMPGLGFGRYPEGFRAGFSAASEGGAAWGVACSGWLVLRLSRGYSRLLSSLRSSLILFRAQPGSLFALPRVWVFLLVSSSLARASLRRSL